MATAQGVRTKKLLAAARKASTAAGKRAEELLALIERRKARIAEDFYEIGLALAEIRKKKLFVALGYSSFGGLLAARKVMSRRTAEKLIGVVSNVPRPKAMELGPEKAYALARLVATTPELDTIDEVLEEGVRVGKGRKKIAGASAREIEEAARAVRAKTEKPDPREVAADKAARTLQAAVRAAGGKGATATASRAKGGFEIVLRVDAARVEALVKALR
ncbi:MAG: hypothetical protein HYV09_26185 [Deltaproteobacteria bacterium]|nr:hypothetical protein [Deltaproteobacteria bacterium]